MLCLMYGNCPSHRLDNMKEKALKRMKSSDLKIKKELKARAELKASKNTAETEEKSPTTNAPASTTGSVKT